MHFDAAGESLRLAEEYRSKGDDELRELAVDFSDLTQPAQQALRNEMHSRKLGDPAAPGAPAPGPFAGARASNAPHDPLQRPRTAPGADEPGIFPAASAFGVLGHSPKVVPDGLDDVGDEDTASEPHDYTWKTVLCDCETNEEAQYLVEALRKSGLDSWVQGSREFGRRYARVLAAADQLEQARAIAAQPIPQNIIDDSKVEVPEYVAPRCPKCGAEDPILEEVDPTNRWHCEQCDAEWSDASNVSGDNLETPADKAP